MTALVPTTACRQEPPRIEVALLIGPGVMRPDSALLTWFSPAGRRDPRRLPDEEATFPAEGQTLTTFAMTLEGDPGAERKILVEAFRGKTKIGAAAQRLHFEPGSDRVELWIAPTLRDSDGDGIPDAIDDDCPKGRCPGGADPSVDGGAAVEGDGPPMAETTRPMDAAPVDASPTAVDADGRDAVCKPPSPPEGAVSDFETGKPAVLALGGRGPQIWYTFDDGSKGMQTLTVERPADARCDNQYALHATAMGFTTWGAGIGFTLKPALAGNKPNPFDATAYKGLRLHARALAPTKVTVQLLSLGTMDNGGLCTTCNDHFRTTLLVGTEWAEVELSFASFKQGGFGVPQLPTADAAHLVGVQLFLDKATPVDLWFDDVGFAP